jgi:hypothetical protein
MQANRLPALVYLKSRLFRRMEDTVLADPSTSASEVGADSFVLAVSG